MSTEYAVPIEIGEPYTFADSSDSIALFTDVKVARISPRRFVVFWAEDSPNETYSEHPYVAARAGYIKDDLSILWGTPVVLYEETERGTIGFQLDVLSNTNKTFFVLINEFVLSTPGNSYYALRGLWGSVSPGNKVNFGGIQDIEAPTTDDNLRIISASLAEYEEGIAGLMYVIGNVSATHTDIKSRLLTYTGSGFNVGLAATDTIATDFNGIIQQAVLSSDHSVVFYIDSGTIQTRRIVERNGGSFSFGPAFNMDGSIAGVNATHFANVQSNQVRICEIDTVSLTLNATGSFVNWHSLATTPRNILTIKTDQLLLIGVRGGNIIANGVSANGTTAIVPESAVNLGPEPATSSFTLLGNGMVVAEFDEEIFSPDYQEFAAAYALTYTGAFTPGTDVYLLGIDSIGSVAYITAWAAGVLVLNLVDLNLGEQYDSIFLGEATLSQVLAKTYVAYPCVISGRIYIFGRINTGIELLHIMYSDNGGNTFTILENTWATDYAGAMICQTVDNFLVMRCNANNSKLYEYSSGELTLRSTLPFLAPVEPHGLRASDWDDSILAVADKDGEAQTVIYSLPPYLSWEDITLNHPQTEVNAVVPL